MERQRERRRTALRRAAVGAGLAVACGAAMLAVTLPPSAAGADGESTAANRARGDDAAVRPGGSGPGAPSPNAASDGVPGVVEAPAPPRETGVGRDPLTRDEIESAKALALAGDRALARGSEDAGGDRGTAQYLSTSLEEAPANGGTGAGSRRRAEVYFYDYADDTLVKKIVDLTDRKVVAGAEYTGAQPPPSREEADEAVTVLLADPLAEGLKRDYRAATGKRLTRASQLDIMALTHRAPQGTSGPLARCGEHRCVRLFTRVADGAWIDVRHLVVDLSARTALRLP